MNSPDRACTDHDCTGIMTHVHGITFQCTTCARSWRPSWVVIDALDRLLSDLSLTEGPAIESVMRIALNERTAGDPDEQASLDDLPTMLNLPDVDPNVFIAWAAFRRERERFAEKVA